MVIIKVHKKFLVLKKQRFRDIIQEGRDVMNNSFGCDLHTHSIYSDGSYSPAEIINEAKKLGLTVALTDHNTVLGLPEFIKEAEKQGVTAVPGIELSTEYNEKELHLIGLFIEPEYYDLIEELTREFLVHKERSNIETVQRLRNAGYDIDYSEVKKMTANGNTNRAHIASVLLKKGYVGSIKEAFDTLLSGKTGFYKSPKRLQFFDGIRFLRKIDVLPILAHPFLELNEQELREMLPSAIDMGLLGIETRHSSFSEDDFFRAKKIANEFGLLESGGSDFHGSVKPTVSMGANKGEFSIPIQIYYELFNKHNEIKARKDT